MIATRVTALTLAIVCRLLMESITCLPGRKVILYNAIQRKLGIHVFMVRTANTRIMHLARPAVPSILLSTLLDDVSCSVR